MRILKRVMIILTLTCCLSVCHARAAGEQPGTRDVQDSWITCVSHRAGHNVLYKMRPDSTRIAFTIASGREHRQGHYRARIRSTEIMVVGIDGSNYDCVLEYPGVLIAEREMSFPERRYRLP